MLARLVLVACTLLFVTGAFPATGHAQIYSWRDEAGNLVLSNRPKDGDTSTFAVTRASLVRTTRPGISRRSEPYDPLIETHSAAHGVSSDLVRAVIQAESAFNPRAVSVKGAMGLMQLMPATASEYGVQNAFDPAENIRAGVAYLKSLLIRYSNKVELALAAYNAGPTAVQKYGAVPPYRETRDYVEKIKKSTTDARPPVRIYRSIEIVNGREVTKYSDVATPGAALVSGGERR